MLRGIAGLGGGLDLILMVILYLCVGPFLYGLACSLLRRRLVGMFLVFLVYVLLVAFWFGADFARLTPMSFASASWLFAFYLVPALIGYGIGYVLTKREKLPLFF